MFYFHAENEEDYLTTPSGRKIRKPERYRVDVEDIDEAVKQEDPGTTNKHDNSVHLGV